LEQAQRRVAVSRRPEPRPVLAAKLAPTVKPVPVLAVPSPGQTAETVALSASHRAQAAVRTVVNPPLAVRLRSSMPAEPQ